MPNESRRRWIRERTAVLEESTSPEELETAAMELASADDPEALEALGVFLRRGEFLDRLDETDSSDRMLHLTRVLTRLIEEPSPEVAHLCLDLVDEPVYLERDRKSLVLEALAAVPLMNIETAEAFRRANEEGYFAFDALLLARNGSPVALELFRSMMNDQSFDVESRVELVHKGILPQRNRLTILQMVASSIADDIEPPIVIAAIESVFDYQPEWFTLHGPTPPAWRVASDDVLQYVIQLETRVKAFPGVPGSLLSAVDDTIDIVSALLAARKT